MEVYNNEVYDLLARDEQGNAVGQRRDVVTTSSGASQVPNLTYEPVCNASEIMQILSGVLKLRAQCPTLIHADSTKLQLVDLAGSECVGRCSCMFFVHGNCKTWLLFFQIESIFT
ncbi:hypothetical protein XENOCAPTIV_029831 [Xenoophorus captivus]|uniref:Kinesin motor domain-containing protein n=1 Tax=Xenoophorus captivus TaxID=1517983 RepID=A0ABV0S1Y4_9TELE